MKLTPFGLLTLLFTVSGVQAATLAEPIQNCSKEENSLQRLVCYGNVSKSLRQYSDSELPTVASKPLVNAPEGSQTAPVLAATPDSSFQVNPADDFGMKKNFGRIGQNSDQG
ncbi:hypothetical protein P2G88_10790 [Aliiglaciecola sp. CAU 1673]|uniref:hypothetical protein n=1 Tax=Aliiglaciecola sp. CAU 1673 TaxID=3032595 RepID=UPI0023DC9970|nr:hypothetical protein [Aliiglaciecola sp. CAU 1673]MDF2178735.1 hypothetical protein [Aliiglaciecola sp. CAU 1673]